MLYNVAFDIPAHIIQGLANGSYERVGGVIREMGSKKIVTWLRDAPNLANFTAGSPINAVGNKLTTLLGSATAITGVLNLAVSTMGFALVLNKLKGIEQQLELAQEILKSIEYKIDLSFYANFRAALDLALNAFTMMNPETRKISAMQAINRFLEAEHHYTKLADIEINNGSQVADEYLSTLCLAYIAETRCYLELEELDTARRRLKESTATLRPRFEKHINTLLTSNPAAYLHPSLKEQIGLKQLTEIYQWLYPGVTENDVFDMQRENIFKLAQQPQQWIESLPQAIHLPKDTIKTNVINDIKKQAQNFLVSKLPKSKNDLQDTIPQSPEMEIYGLLPIMMTLIGSMVEDYNRLAMYESEVETIQQLGMGFHDWQKLTPPSSVQPNESGLMYITMS